MDHFLYNGHAIKREKHVETAIPVMFIIFWQLIQRAFAQVLRDKSNVDWFKFQVLCI